MPRHRTMRTTRHASYQHAGQPTDPLGRGQLAMQRYLTRAVLRRGMSPRTLHARVVTAAFALLLMSGCAKTTVSDRQSYEGPRLARPARILVYDFAASQADLPAGYGTAVSAPPVDQTADDLSLGRKLGAEVAKDLVEDLQQMNLPAVSANGQPPPQLNDIAIVGYFVSIDSGSIAKRFAIGFGSGSPELATVVEAYVMTN